MTLRTTLLVLVAAGFAHAHSVPIPPSLCAIDPLTFTAPATGFAASAAPAGASEMFRIVYDAGSSGTQLCAADPSDPQNRCAATTPARTVSGPGVSGSIAVTAFAAHLFASGDLVAASVPLALTLGATTDRVSVPFTTGLILAGNAVAEGSPIAADGRFTLVGTVTFAALPAPLGGTPLVVRMSCTAAPPPDLDQFDPTASTTKVGGKIAGDGVKVRVVFRAGSATPPDFAAPAIVRLAAGDATIAAVSLPAGLQGAGRRKFAGKSADGQADVVVKRVRGTTYKMTVRVAAATPPAGSTPIEVAYQVGGLLSRATRTFRARGGGLRAP